MSGAYDSVDQRVEGDLFRQVGALAVQAGHFVADLLGVLVVEEDEAEAHEHQSRERDGDEEGGDDGV